MLKILFVAPEVSPFSKTGGLADVTGSLPKALRDLGHSVTILTPFYRSCRGKINSEVSRFRIEVPLKERIIEGTFYRSALDGDIPIYFLKRDEFYDRSSLYSTPEGDYFDNAERFIFFSRATIEFIKKGGVQPDIIHCHDWQTALVPVYLKTIYRGILSKATTTVFTIHNIAYQGVFPKYTFPYTGLPERLLGINGLEFWGKVNFMKGGILFSDITTTVSERYKDEIQTPRYGYGLDGVLRSRKNDLYGVLNGVDYKEWNPLTDQFLIANYNEDDLSGKLLCKKDLIERYRLNIPVGKPLIGIISRLCDQKGFDIISRSIEELMKLDLGIVILGTGDMEYRKLLKRLSRKYRGRLGVRITFDNVLAHKIEAGCDMFLMPSRYEPCGLNQIYSLKYGTIPVVRATGGLDDTIHDYDPDKGSGNGFKFRDYTPEAMIDKIRFALDTFKDKRVWKKLIRRAMKADFSWNRSAMLYEKIYKKAGIKRRDSYDTFKYTHK